MTIYNEDIKIVRLISGEELLAKVTTLADGNVKLETPVILIPQQSGPQGGDPRNQKLQIVMVPWIPYTTAQTDGVPVNPSAIVFIVNSEEGLLKSYKEQILLKGKMILPTAAGAKSGIISPSSFAPRN